MANNTETLCFSKNYLPLLHHRNSYIKNEISKHYTFDNTASLLYTSNIIKTLHDLFYCKMVIKFLNDLPDNTVGIHITGEVTKQEYEADFLKQMTQFAEGKSSINYLVILDIQLSEIETGAIWDDFQLALKFFSKWNKIAILSRSETIITLMNTLGFVLPGKHKGFRINEYDDAIQWFLNR